VDDDRSVNLALTGRRVVVVIFDQFQSLDALGPIEVFDHASTALGQPAYVLEVVAPEAGPVASSSRVQVTADRALAEVDDADLDTLVVAGGNGVYALLDRPEVVAEVRRLAAAARRVASVCTGAYLLAEAGLLDGRRVTTHWIACDHLQERYPALEVDPDPIFVSDGRLATSAGVTAGMDLALQFVEDDHGHALALDVARSLVLFLRRPGNQAQLSAPLSGQLADSTPLRDLQEWVVEHLADDLTVDRLAERANQSPRTFARRFREEVGMTPARWVEALRLEQARRLLEEGRQPVEEVARRCGLQPESIRRLFHRQLGLGPSEYRRRFGAAVTTPTPTPATTTPTTTRSAS
jgi:transcriptional regulator GlxA family with amidase domain